MKYLGADVRRKYSKATILDEKESVLERRRHYKRKSRLC